MLCKALLRRRARGNMDQALVIMSSWRWQLYSHEQSGGKGHRESPSYFMLGFAGLVLRLSMLVVLGSASCMLHECALNLNCE